MRKSGVQFAKPKGILYFRTTLKQTVPRSMLKPTTLANPSILLVDDDQILLHVTKRILQHDGYKVTTATNGKEALDKIRNTQFDLVIVDVMMPYINGLEVLSQLKQQQNTRSTPVIVLTGVSHSISEDVLKIGASACFKKPFEADTLREAVRQQLAK